MRAVAFSWMIVALAGLSACATDNGPQVGSPPAAAGPEAPTAASLAWAGAVVTDALAAEKSARAAGKDEVGIQSALRDLVESRLDLRSNDGVSFSQVVAGIDAALHDPRDTPAVTAALQAVRMQITQLGPSGSCPGCKG